jgi:hypothetical protein
MRESENASVLNAIRFREISLQSFVFFRPHPHLLGAPRAAVEIEPMEAGLASLLAH